MKKISKSLSYGSTVFVAAMLVFTHVIWSGVAHGSSPETWLGLPVTYIENGYTFRPWPAQALRDMKIHTPDPILIAKAWVTPDWNAWITSGKTNRVRIEAEEIVARPSSLAKLGAFDGRSTHKVTSVRFTKLKLLMGATAVVLPAGEIEFAEDGTLTHLRITTEQGMRFDATPHDGKLGVLTQLSGWKWDVLPALRFENIVAQGDLNDDRLLLDKIGGTGDGGSIEGLLRLTVTEKFVVDGELKLEKLDSGEVLKRLYPGHTVLGALFASVKVAASGESLGALGTNMTSSGTYVLRSGSIDRFGLLEGLRRQQSGPAGGGLTKFVTMEGGFSGGVGKPSSISIRRLDGGAMQGSGSVQIALDGQLRGNVSASIKLPNGDSSSRTLALTGTVNAPTLTVP